MTTRALPSESAIAQSRFRLADLARVFLDIDEEVEIGLRARETRRMQADELDALRDAGLDRVLQARGVGEHGDAVGLQRDRLVHAGEPRGRAALAVDDRHLPAELLGRLLDIDAVEMRDVVLLVAGEKDDRSCRRSGLGARGRALPFRLRAGVMRRRPPWPVGDRVGARAGTVAAVARAASAAPPRDLR